VGVKFGYGIVDFAFNPALLEKGKPLYKVGWHTNTLKLGRQP